eukprot:c27223_g1_i4 orf=197-1408(+)
MAMSGKEILCHFADRLARAEAALPSLANVSRFSHSLTVQDLDVCRRSYEGTPVVFPASWVPSWKETLGAASLTQGLRDLLCESVEVEVFRLMYNMEGNVHASRNSLSNVATIADTREVQLENIGSVWTEKSPLSFVSGSSRELCSTAEGVFERKELGAMDTSSQLISTELNRKFLKETVSLLNVDPIPISSTEMLEFGDFVSEAQSLLSETKNQLMYLTWRSLPDLNTICHDHDAISSEFRNFIETLVHPTSTPDFISSDSIKQRNLWMGALVTSRLHFDALDNVHVCLSGKKLFHLYSPKYLPNMYPDPWREEALNNFSSIQSVFLADPALHPRFFYAKCLKAEIREGEAIFIPAGWWHEVFTFQETISINVWFGPSPNAYFRPSLLHLKSEKYLKFMLECK